MSFWSLIFWPLHRRQRAVVCCLGLTLGAIAVFSLLPPSGGSVALAQQAADDNLDQPAPPPAAAAARGKAEEPTQQQESMLKFYFKALGWFYTIAFLFLSFCLVALLVMNLLALRRDAIMPQALIDGFEQQLNEKHYQEAFELAKSDDSVLAHVLAAGMAQLKSGYSQAVSAMEETGTDENMRLEHRLSYIALIGAISPMVGLLGTVDGMVEAFMVIAQSATTPKPSQLANGISTALITTLVGLWLAIPAIGIHGILRNRVTRIVFEMGMATERLMGRFAEMGKKI